MTLYKVFQAGSAFLYVVRVAILIAMSDGVFEESEKKAVRELCAELNVPASDFDC